MRENCMRKALFSVLLAALCAGQLIAQERSSPANPSATGGVVFVVAGIGGIELLYDNARSVLPRSGTSYDLREFSWQHGKGRLLRDLQDTKHIDQKAVELAEQIRQAKQHDPDRPVYLIGHSAGAGLVLEAARQLPPLTVERIILLSAAVSPTYDLRPALHATRREIISYYSSNDTLVLGLGTMGFGTVDRVHCPAAGMSGFEVPENPSKEDQRLYDRLVQVPWKPEMLLQFDSGGHNSTVTPTFLSRHVVPWLK
jgi:pimeloyl-ACP methyl ester carboxylesterase